MTSNIEVTPYFIYKTSWLLTLQGSDALLEGGNLLLGVALLLALHGNDGLGGILHEALVGELLLDAGQEALEVLQLSLHLLDLGLHVNHIAKGYGVFDSTYHESGGGGVFLGD